jgi:hypothetical protein
MRNHTTTIDPEARFRNDIVERTGPQAGPAPRPVGNLVELFQRRSPTTEA